MHASARLGSPFRIARVLAPLVATVLAAPLLAAPLLDVETTSKKKEKANPVAEASTAPIRAKIPMPGGPADPAALWWNDAGIVKSLSLTETQRKKMDAYLAAYRKKVPEARRRAAFHEALAKGDWAEARKQLAKLSQFADESVRTRGNLKIEALSLLSKEQHKKLVDHFPRLIYKPWGRAMRADGS